MTVDVDVGTLESERAYQRRSHSQRYMFVTVTLFPSTQTGSRMLRISVLLVAVSGAYSHPIDPIEGAIAHGMHRHLLTETPAPTPFPSYAPTAAPSAVPIPAQIGRAHV